MSYLKSECHEWVSYCLSSIPGQIGKRIRKWYWKGLNADTGLVIRTIDTGKVIYGIDVYCNKNVILDASKDGLINIGHRTIIGYNTVIRASNHSIGNKVILKSGHKPGKIMIGEDCWIGANCTILDGADIGNRCVIGAGAVVNGLIPDDSIAVGIPAKVIKKREYA